MRSAVKAGQDHDEPQPDGCPSMRVKSSVKAGTDQGRIMTNHNQIIKGLRVKSGIKAGDGGDRIISNHNQTARKG